jgi:hypothetical protein
MCLAGSFDVRRGAENTRVEFGQTLLLPAALGQCEIVPNGQARILSCVVPV